MNNDLLEKLSEISNKASSAHISLDQLLEFEKTIKDAITERVDKLTDKHGLLSKVKYPRFNLKYLLSVPFIYGMIFPALIWHLALVIYQNVCFRLYGIPLVNPDEYFVLDRKLLSLLSFWERINCYYCSYVNNLIRFSAEVGGRTERFWCPIKYYRRISNAHSQYDKFIDIKDKKDLRDNWEELRDFSDLDS